MKSIEVQRREMNRWAHHAYFDDAELAVAEARRLVEAGRYDGVRVIEDDFSGDSDTSKSKYLFVSSPKSVRDAGPTPSVRAAPSARAAQTADTAQVAVAKKATRKKKNQSSVYWLVVILLVILAGGGGAMYVMRSYVATM